MKNKVKQSKTTARQKASELSSGGAIAKNKRKSQTNKPNKKKTLNASDETTAEEDVKFRNRPVLSHKFWQFVNSQYGTLTNESIEQLSMSIKKASNENITLPPLGQKDANIQTSTEYDVLKVSGMEREENNKPIDSLSNRINAALLECDLPNVPKPTNHASKIPKENFIPSLKERIISSLKVENLSNLDPAKVDNDEVSREIRTLSCQLRLQQNKNTKMKKHLLGLSKSALKYQKCEELMQKVNSDILEMYSSRMESKSNPKEALLSDFKKIKRSIEIRDKIIEKRNKYKAIVSSMLDTTANDCL